MGHASPILKIGLVQRYKLGVVRLTQELELKEDQRGLALTAHIEGVIKEFLPIGQNELNEAQSEDLFVSKSLFLLLLLANCGAEG